MEGPSTLKGSITNLAPEHLNTFEQTLSKILLADNSRLTFTQIIDGLPVKDIWRKYQFPRVDIEKHLQLCPAAVEAWKLFKEHFQPRTLQFDVSLLQAYQNSEIGSKEFQLRLLELVAVGCHNIGVLLYKSVDGGVGTHEQKPTPPVFLDENFEPLPSTPTDFYHKSYKDWQQYPDGVANMVGYWVESQIFGGVVIFDRGRSEIECKEAFIHPVGNFKIFQLLDSQLREFFDLHSTDSHLPLPFPFKASREARRVDENESMSLHIFRDKYERKPKVNTSRKTQQPKLRMEDDPFTLSIVERYNANGGSWDPK
ncbi:hypothetical protein BGZ60DRAFT_402789 [Tricladium varicosporioides]|nr:hypothetical protein BGZ60DRAFT_402789 [Hymenoscyphus varicosporioides]